MLSHRSRRNKRKLTDRRINTYGSSDDEETLRRCEALLIQMEGAVQWRHCEDPDLRYWTNVKYCECDVTKFRPDHQSMDRRIAHSYCQLAPRYDTFEGCWLLPFSSETKKLYHLLMSEEFLQHLKHLHICLDTHLYNELHALVIETTGHVFEMVYSQFKRRVALFVSEGRTLHDQCEGFNVRMEENAYRIYTAFWMLRDWFLQPQHHYHKLRFLAVKLSHNFEFSEHPAGPTVALQMHDEWIYERGINDLLHARMCEELLEADYPVYYAQTHIVLILLIHERMQKSTCVRAMSCVLRVRGLAVKIAQYCGTPYVRCCSGKIL